MPSVWDNYQGGVTLPPNTPNIEIVPSGLDCAVVINGQQPPAHTGSYRECSLYVKNNYRLTSTMMIPIVTAYEKVMEEQVALVDEMMAEIIAEAATPPEVQPTTSQNKYRKPGK